MLVIVDYGVGNLTSISNMLKKAGAQSLISGKYDDVAASSKIILPGMGAFDNCIEKLNQSGLREIIFQKAIEEKIPVLGICVGLQMFMEFSEEGKLPGLGWLKGRTIRFLQEKMKEPHKVPNLGWLDVNAVKASPLLNDMQDARFYFAHSYHVQLENPSDALITANYGYDFTVGIERDNILGVQFHPEKSHRFGMQMLKNFAFSY